MLGLNLGLSNWINDIRINSAKVNIQFKRYILYCIVFFWFKHWIWIFSIRLYMRFKTFFSSQENQFLKWSLTLFFVSLRKENLLFTNSKIFPFLENTISWCWHVDVPKRLSFSIVWCICFCDENCQIDRIR